jgi:hypothetical protein
LAFIKSFLILDVCPNLLFIQSYRTNAISPGPEILVRKPFRHFQNFPVYPYRAFPFQTPSGPGHVAIVCPSEEEYNDTLGPLVGETGAKCRITHSKLAFEKYGYTARFSLFFKRCKP